MENNEFQWPSVYDDFYYFKCILEKILDIARVNKFFDKCSIDFKVNVYGYLYFVELLLIQIIGQIELLIGNEELKEFVRWGGKDLSSRQIQELKSNIMFSYIFKLNKFRKQFSKIRFKDNIKYDDIQKIKEWAREIKSQIAELNAHIIKVYEVKKIQGKETHERSSILYWINDFNFIKIYGGDSGTALEFIIEKSPEPPLPNFPGQPFFYLMPKQTKVNYYLQNQRIKKKNSEYLTGYKFCLLFLYLDVLEHDKRFLIKSFNGINSWMELNALAHVIYDNHISGKFRGEAIFLIDESKIKSTENPQKISYVNKKDQFETIFRGRDVKVIDKNFMYDDYAQNWFLHIFFGTLSRNEFARFHNSDNKPEIIEFRQLCGIFTIYSYAVYFPKHGAISDSSHWIIFDELDSESPFNKKLYFRRQFLELLEDVKEVINFKSIVVEGYILNEYLTNKDSRIKKNKLLEGKLSHSIGFISEFLSFLYVNRKYNAQLIDFHKDFEDTDIDVLAETEGGCILIEAKQHLSFDKNELKNKVINHLSKIERKIDYESIKKIFFVMNTPNIHNLTNENHSVIANEKFEIKKSKKRALSIKNPEANLNLNIDDSVVSILDEDIVEKCIEIKDFLHQNNVELVFYEDLVQLLKNHNDLMDKIKKIYELNRKKNLFDEM